MCRFGKAIAFVCKEWEKGFNVLAHVKNESCRKAIGPRV